MEMHVNRGLILTVGMSVQSEVFAIAELQPSVIAFLCTGGSLDKVGEIANQARLNHGQYQIFEVEDDPKEVGLFVAKVHDAYRWIEGKVGESGEIVVNPTAGRKWMSTAMTLFAGQTDVRIAYVDVTFRNGQPDPESMRLVDLGNADDATALIGSQQPVALFNRFDFEGAAESFARLKPTLSAPRRLYEALRKVSASLARWDRFEHYGERKQNVGNSLDESTREAYEAARELRMYALQQWAEQMRGLSERISRVSRATHTSLDAVADLFANATRKHTQGRYEDAGARLYRALEAVGQWMLIQKEVKTSEVDWSSIPEDVVSRYRATRFDKTAKLPTKLGLTESFALAKAYNCEGAEDFFNPNFIFDNELLIRNQSILAHGWTPAKRDHVERFREKVEERLKALGVDLLGWDVPKLPDLWR